MASSPSSGRFRPKLVMKLFVAALALVAVVITIILILSSESGMDLKKMAENKKVISRDGTTIAFSKLGGGPALVLVDGAFCYRENGPTPELAPLLAQNFTVFAYDRRGRGESGDQRPYALEREVEDLKAIIDEAGGSALVVGISSGAGVALQAAASGLPIKKLALYEPPYITRNGSPVRLDAAQSRLEQLVSSGDRGGAVKLFMTDVFGAPKAFVFFMPFVMPRAWRNNKSVANTLTYDLTILSDWSVLTGRRSSIHVPTLVLGGEKSPPELRGAVETVANAIPNARRQFLKGQSHMFSADVVAPVLREFFEN